MARKKKSKANDLQLETASATSEQSNISDLQEPPKSPALRMPKSPTRNGSAAAREKQVELLAAQPASQKWKNLTVRTIWTLVMIFGFFAIMAAGHVWVILLIIVVQTLVYKEVIALAQVPTREKKLRSFKALNWYFLVSTNYFLYGESMIYYFKHIVFVDNLLLPIALHHRFISFILYMIGEPADLTVTWLTCRIRLFCRKAEEGPLPFPICSILLDTHDIAPRRVLFSFLD